MDLFIQTLINGILIGGLYILIAIGFSLAFGVLHIIDFAVGEWVMLGAFTAYWVYTLSGVDPILSIPINLILYGIAGYFLYPLIQRIIQQKHRNAILMALAFTFGLSIFFRGSALSLWGFNNRNIVTFISDQSISLLGVTFPVLRLVAFIFAVLTTILFMLFIYKTPLGLAIRVTAENKEIAGLMGIDGQAIARIVYTVYASITGMAGVFIGSIFSINAEMGMRYTAFAFFVVVAGGLGSLGGAIVAGLLLGLIASLVSVYLSSTYTMLILFLVLYLILVFFPRGILRKGWL